MTRFRKRLHTYLWNRTTSYPKTALSTRSQFVEEVIEESLIKFFQLLPTGIFSSYGDLEATVVTMASYKLKEGFARLRKERRIYLAESDELERLKNKSVEEERQIDEDTVRTIKQHISQLEEQDKMLLQRYFNGEELQDIAEDLEISAAACRKRKQRLIEKLKSAILDFLILLPLLIGL